MRGISKFKLSPYSENTWLFVLVQPTVEEVEKHFTTTKSDLFSLDTIANIKYFSTFAKLTKEKFHFNLEEQQRVEKGDGFIDYFAEDLNVYVIVISELTAERKNNPEELVQYTSTVSHELLHLCQKFLPKYLNRDIEFEAEAYFHQSLLLKIMKEVLNDDLDIIF
jgi:hypothetical protein